MSLVNCIRTNAGLGGILSQFVQMFYIFDLFRTDFSDLMNTQVTYGFQVSAH